MEDIPQSESTVVFKEKKKAIGISSWLSSLQSRKHLRKDRVTEETGKEE